MSYILLTYDEEIRRYTQVDQAVETDKEFRKLAVAQPHGTYYKAKILGQVDIEPPKRQSDTVMHYASNNPTGPRLPRSGRTHEG